MKQKKTASTENNCYNRWILLPYGN